MRALILSDLHIEHAPFVAPRDGYDVVILAGDVHNGVHALTWARTTFPHHPIVQIAGNHEYYDHIFEQCREDMRITAQALEINLLDDSAVVLDGVAFYGCTLWTDFRVFEHPRRAIRLSANEAMQANRGLMADYLAIRTHQGETSRATLRNFEPADSARLHQQSRRWLSRQFEQSDPIDRAIGEQLVASRVVISHHLPSWRSVSPRFEHSVTNAAFVSDLDELVAQADWWIHGHTHSSHEYRIGDCRVLSNPRGYPSRSQPGLFENRRFRDDLIIDLSVSGTRFDAVPNSGFSSDIVALGPIGAGSGR